MKDNIRLYGTLTAAADDGSLSYKLLPFGEPGATNKGKLTVPGPGVVKLPADPSAVVANMEHDSTKPLGRAVALEEREDAIYAKFMPADTTAGRDWREEARAGLRPGISVELAHPTIRGGVLLAGELSGAGACVRPAYSSALVLAADAGELAGDLEDAAAAIAAGDLEAAAAAIAAAHEKATADDGDDDQAQETNDDGEPADDDEEKKVTASKMGAPAAGSLLARKSTGNSNTVEASEDKYTLTKLTAAMAAAGAGDASVLAAFSTVTQGNVFDVTTQPTWIGELNIANPYKRRYADLISHRDLTGPKVQGWRFVPEHTPIVRPYAGNFEEIASREVKTEPVEFSAGRFAGGNKVDRINYDFPNPDFWTGYLRESREDYDRQIDMMVRDLLISSALPTQAGPEQAGVAAGWSKLVDGALAIWDFAFPNFALVGMDLYRDMALTTEKDRLAFLNASLGLDEASAAGFIIRPVSGAANLGSVTVGSTQAGELQELPGLIRVSAVDVSHGAVDEGVYGYGGAFLKDARGLVKVVDTLPAAKA